jgi:hypothetical protein
MEPPLTQTIKNTHSAATRKPSSFLVGGQRISIKFEVGLYNSYTKKGQKWSFLLIHRSNYHFISFPSNKAFNVITNRAVIATVREVLRTVFAVMVTLYFLSHFVSGCGHMSKTLCHVISIQNPSLQINLSFSHFLFQGPVKESNTLSDYSSSATLVYTSTSVYIYRTTRRHKNRILIDADVNLHFYIYASC